MCNIHLYYLLIVLRNNDIIINNLYIENSYSSISIIIIIVTISIINKERGVGINAQDYLFTPPRPMHILPVANIPIIIMVFTTSPSIDNSQLVKGGWRRHNWHHFHLSLAINLEAIICALHCVAWQSTVKRLLYTFLIRHERFGAEIN